MTKMLLNDYKTKFFNSDSSDEEFTPADMSMDSVDIISSDSDEENFAQPGKIEIIDDNDVQENILQKVKQKQEALAKKRKDHPTSGNPPPAKKAKNEPKTDTKNASPATTPDKKGKQNQQKGKQEQTPPKGKQEQTTPKGTPKGKQEQTTPRGKQAKNEPATTPEKKR